MLSPAFRRKNCVWGIEFKAFLKQPRSEDYHNFQSLKLRQNPCSRIKCVVVIRTELISWSRQWQWPNTIAILLQIIAKSPCRWSIFSPPFYSTLYGLFWPILPVLS